MLFAARTASNTKTLGICLASLHGKSHPYTPSQHPVNIIPTTIGSKMGGEFTTPNQNGIPKTVLTHILRPSLVHSPRRLGLRLGLALRRLRGLRGLRGLRLPLGGLAGLRLENRKSRPGRLCAFSVVQGFLAQIRLAPLRQTIRTLTQRVPCYLLRTALKGSKYVLRR